MFGQHSKRICTKPTEIVAILCLVFTSWQLFKKKNE
jgi:hypothetical protein